MYRISKGVWSFCRIFEQGYVIVKLKSCGTYKKAILWVWIIFGNQCFHFCSSTFPCFLHFDNTFTDFQLWRPLLPSSFSPLSSPPTAATSSFTSNPKLTRNSRLKSLLPTTKRVIGNFTVVHFQTITLFQLVLCKEARPRNLPAKG